MFLQVSQLGVRYAGRSRPAVDGVSLNLQAGDIGVLIGPSGCGKTTLLRAVAGLEPVSEGSISLEGRVVSSATVALPPEQRRIGMVFQDYALFPHLSVGRNVMLAPSLVMSQPKNVARANAERLLDRVGLAGG